MSPKKIESATLWVGIDGICAKVMFISQLGDPGKTRKKVM
jgi:hypothetical protein